MMADTKSESLNGHASNIGKPTGKMRKESFPEPPLMKAVFTHLGYGIMILLGHILDFLRRLGLKSDPYSKALKNEVLAGKVHA